MATRFLLFSLSFIAGMLIGDSVHAQSQDTWKHDLTVREIVNALVEFDVYHVAQQPFFPPAYGVTDFSSTPPSIWIFTTSTLHNRRGTVIHELLHVRCDTLAIICDEKDVAEEEERQYKALFGLQ